MISIDIQLNKKKKQERNRQTDTVRKRKKKQHRIEDVHSMIISGFDVCARDERRNKSKKPENNTTTAIKLCDYKLYTVT